MLKPQVYLLVELTIVIGLLALILPALVGGLFVSHESDPQQQMRLQVVALLKGTEAAVKNVRDNDWISFAVNGTFHTAIQSKQWRLQPVIRLKHLSSMM